MESEHTMDKNQQRPEHSWQSDVIAVTGTIGSGKSTFVRLLKELGAFVVDADQLAREVVEPGADALKEIVVNFGTEVLQEDGSLDRKALGTLIFNAPEKREILEKVLHPKIRERAKDKFQSALNDGHTKLIYEIPLLFETGSDKLGFKSIVTVFANDQICRERILKRNPELSEAQVRSRIKSQLPVEKKIAGADITIDNSTTLNELQEKAQRLIDSL